MAIGGNGQSVDVAFQLGAQLKTSTSQYKTVAIAGQTTSADFTVELTGQTNTVATPTAASRSAIGVMQEYNSAGSTQANVRLFGVSKVVCADSVTAGDFLVSYEGISTTTMAGRVVAIAPGLSTLAGTTSITSFRVVLGRALESGQTNTVISAFINPQFISTFDVGAA
jgi:hypothetical protein